MKCILIRKVKVYRVNIESLDGYSVSVYMYRKYYGFESY